MKLLPLFLALFAVSCVSKTAPVVKVQPSPGYRLSRADAEKIRLPEKIKAYPLGRYSDPNHRGVMHEAHTIYRVETTPKWNLAERGRGATVVPASATGADFSSNELRVELNRQREVTKAVMESGSTVSTKLTDLATSLQKSQQTLIEQNIEARKELQSTRQRLDALERQPSAQPALATPETSSSLDDSPW